MRSWLTIPLSPEMATFIPPTRREHGLIIVALRVEGTTASMDLQVEDVLYTLNRKMIDTFQGLRKAALYGLHKS
jgi:hypothetical protein